MSTPDAQEPVVEAAEKVKEAAERIDPMSVASIVKVGGAVMSMAVGFALIGSGVHGLWTNRKGNGGTP